MSSTVRYDINQGLIPVSPNSLKAMITPYWGYIPMVVQIKVCQQPDYDMQIILFIVEKLSSGPYHWTYVIYVNQLIWSDIQND